MHVSEERLELERETTAFEASALDNERARAALAEQVEHQAARELARQEEELALLRERRSPRKSALNLPSSEVEEAAEALGTRAALVVFALRAYGIPRGALGRGDRGVGACPRGAQERAGRCTQRCR